VTGIGRGYSLIWKRLRSSSAAPWASTTKSLPLASLDTNMNVPVLGWKNVKLPSACCLGVKALRSSSLNGCLPLRGRPLPCRWRRIAGSRVEQTDIAITESYCLEDVATFVGGVSLDDVIWACHVVGDETKTRFVGR